MQEKLRVNTFLFGQPLKQGIKYIGIWDIIWLLVNVSMTIATAAGVKNFLVPERSKYWILLIRVFLVDILRAIALVLVLHFNSSKRSRFMMFLVRLLTVPLELFLLIYTYVAAAGSSAGLILFYLILAAVNTYFGIVILSYYRITEHEEIQIELQRLGADKIGVDLHSLGVN